MIKPLYDRVVVSCEAEQETTASGILVTGVNRPQQGTVIAVGTGYVQQDGSIRPLEVKVGDTVIFPRGTGYALDINSTDILVFLENELIGIVE